MTGGYRYTHVSLAADIGALTQLAAFAFGNLYTSSGSLFAKPPIVVDSVEALKGQLPNLRPNDIAVTNKDHKMWRVLADNNNNNTFVQVMPE